MAQRRMFSKTITNSGKFLKMPSTSRLLYYDLGMNADDDGYSEWFTVIRMSGSTEQDLQVLQANGFVKVYDENVLVILDWKENNYLRSDRYTPSKYLDKYDKMERLPFGIPKVDTGKDRLGKVSIDNTATELPIWLNKKAWEEWVQYRKEKNKKLTPTTIKLQLALLEKNKSIQVSIIYNSMRNGWTGLFEPKITGTAISMIHGKQRFDNKREDEGNIEFNENYRKIQEMKKGLGKTF